MSSRLLKVRAAVLPGLTLLAALSAARHGSQPSPSSRRLYDIDRLVGAPVIQLRGTVLTPPQTSPWSQRVLVRGRAWPLEAFDGTVMVSLPPDAPALAPGDEVTLRGWLSSPLGPRRSGGFDERLYLTQRGVMAKLRVWPGGHVARTGIHPSLLLSRWAWQLRSTWRRTYKAFLEPDESVILEGMTLGRTPEFPEHLKQAFLRAGVYDLLVVSGSNVGFVVAACALLSRVIPVPRRLRLAMMLPVLWFYIEMVGADPPVLRAFWMAAYGITAILTWREISPLRALAASAFVLLLWRPVLVFGVSFQLSYMATLAILFFFPLWSRLGRTWPKLLRVVFQSVIISLSVELVLLPLLAYYFGRVSWIGFLTHMVALPWVMLCMMGGFVLGGLSPFPVFCRLVAWPMEAILWSFKETVMFFAALPGASSEVPVPSLSMLVSYYAWCAFVIMLARRFYVEKTG